MLPLLLSLLALAPVEPGPLRLEEPRLALDTGGGAGASGKWYGLPILLADAVSLVVLFGGDPNALGPQAGVLNTVPILQLGGAAGLLLGGPIIHGLGHKSPRKALLSLALRAVPVATVLAGLYLKSTDPVPCESFVCPNSGTVVVVVGAVLAAAVSGLDAWKLAWTGSSGFALRQDVEPSRAVTLHLTPAGLALRF